jgi:hypothetical protein
MQYYGAFKTTGRKVGALERGQPEFPTWNSELDDRSKSIFPVGAHLERSKIRSWRFHSSEFPVVLPVLPALKQDYTEVSSHVELHEMRL